MKLTNKLLLSMGAIAATVTPIIAVVSCGKSNDKNNEQIDRISAEEIKALEDKINQITSSKNYLSNYSNQTPEEFVTSHMKWDSKRSSWVSKNLDDFGLSFLNNQSDFSFDISTNLSFESNNLLGKVFFTINVWHSKNSNLESGYGIQAESLNFKSSDPEHLQKIRLHDEIKEHFYDKFGTDNFDGENLSISSSTLSNKSFKEFLWNKTSTGNFKHFDARGANIALVENELGVNFMPTNADFSMMSIVGPDIDKIVKYGRDSNGWTTYDVQNMFENGYVELKLIGDEFVSGNDFNESNPFLIKVSGFKNARQTFDDAKNTIVQRLTHTSNGETWTGLRVTDSPFNYEYYRDSFNWGRQTETAYGVVTTGKQELNWDTEHTLGSIYKQVRTLFFDPNYENAAKLWGCSITPTNYAEFDDSTKTIKVHWVFSDSPFSGGMSGLSSEQREFEYNSFNGFGRNTSEITFTIKFSNSK